MPDGASSRNPVRHAASGPPAHSEALCAAEAPAPSPGRPCVKGPSRVALVRCGSYDASAVSAAVERGLGLLGGPGVFASRGEHVLLKPNLLVGDDPDKCVTTHPEVFKAVARALKAQGAEMAWGDSPMAGSAARHGAKSGLAAAAAEAGVAQADFDAFEEVLSPRARWMKRLPLCSAALRAGGIVSLPKLKTHGLMRFTGAVKNQFGCVPGLRKSGFHVRLPGPVEFARLLVDITAHLRPRLYVMDAVCGMEGNGPRSGTPRMLGALIMSSDPVALDSVACRIICMPFEVVPTFGAALEAGLGECSPGSVEIAGDPLEDFLCPDFRADRRPPKPLRGGRMLTFAKALLSERPRVSRSLCRACGACVQICPASPKAMEQALPDRAPRVSSLRCIRCFCCQEACPHGAIGIKTPLLGRILCLG